MKKFMPWLLCSLMLTACASQRQQTRQREAPRAQVLVNAVALEKTEGNSYFIYETAGAEDNTALQRDRFQLEQALAQAGFVAPRENFAADLQIHFDIETAGKGSSFTHTLTMTAKKRGRVVWHTTITVYSDKSDHREILPQFVTAGGRWFGQNSNGLVAN